MVEGLETERGWRVGLERPLNTQFLCAVPAAPGRKFVNRKLVVGAATTVLVGAVLTGCSSSTPPRLRAPARRP